MRHTLVLLMLCVATIMPSRAISAEVNAKAVLQNYSQLVYANYKDAYSDALLLQIAVEKLLENPTDANLAAAKKAWLVSRNSYGQTEAFRFYDGPIDFVDLVKGVEGPEGRLNSWPLNEAYIDYVKGNPNAGIVNNSAFEITVASLKDKNQAEDEADVSTGYHAIEFLLWGQDFSTDSAGARPVSDFAKGNATNERRRAYLKAVTELLVEDLKFLVKSWEPNKKNYAAEFVAGDAQKNIEKLLSAIATFSGFELASERIATALDSGDQEDEHSCFSDNTHNDFIYNFRGISNVFFGKYKDVKGASLYQLIKAKDHDLAEKIEKQIFTAAELMDNIPQPIDREVLASPADSAGRAHMEKVIVALQQIAESMKAAGKALGVNVQIISE